MTERRPMGSLEADVLRVLWTADAPVTPAQVRAQLDDALAYTTVMTVLSRLHDKGLLSRTRVGRAYAYAPQLSEAELAARRMRTALGTTTDQLATMSHFVDALTPGEAETLRAALEQTADGRAEPDRADT